MYKEKSVDLPGWLMYKGRYLYENVFFSDNSCRDFRILNNTYHIVLVEWYISGLVPPAPSNLQGKALPDVSIEVTWEAPDTELSIQKYAVNYQAYGGMERLVRN